MHFNNKDKVLSNPYTLDSGPSVGPHFYNDPVVLDDYDNNIVSALYEDNNNKHVISIDN